jgi:hypothetical protein
VGLPTLSVGRLTDGLSGISPLLATAIPLGSMITRVTMNMCGTDGP